MTGKFKKRGTEAKFLSPQEFASFIAGENRRMTAITRVSGVEGNDGGTRYARTPTIPGPVASHDGGREISPPSS